MSNEKKSFGINAIEVDETEETTITQVETEPTTITPIEEKKTKIGVVSNCARLNIRRKPNVSALIVGVMVEGDKVEITSGVTSSEGWYKIKTLAGDKAVFGYCMAEYITLEE